MTEMAESLQDALSVLLEQSVADGMGSAAAIGWIDVDGRRSVVHTGHTKKWVGACAPYSLELGESIGRHALFDLASLTKPMVTTTLLGQLVERGVLSLADSLESRWPVAKGTYLGSLPLKMLLGHASGSIAWRDYFALTRQYSGAARVAAVQRAVLAEPHINASGQLAVYSDLGFLDLGWMLEHVLGQSLDKAFAQHVAAPLGIEHAHFPKDSPSSDHRYVCTEIWKPRDCGEFPLQGVVHDDNCAALGGVAGHAGLFGCVDDVLSWSVHWLRAICGFEALSPTAPSTELGRHWVSTAAAPNTTWRLGFDTPSSEGSSAGERVHSAAFGHLGFTGTSVWICPVRRVAVVILTNRVHPDREHTQAIRSFRPQVHDIIWSHFDAH